MHVSLTFGRVEPFGPEVPEPDLVFTFAPLSGEGEGGRFAAWKTPSANLPPTDLELAYPGAGRLYDNHDEQRRNMQARIGEEAMLERPASPRHFMALWRVTGKQGTDEINREHQKNTARVFERIVCALPLRPVGTEGGPRQVVYLFEASDEADFQRLYESDAAVQNGVVECTPYRVEVG
jgi:hypothetical protein